MWSVFVLSSLDITSVDRLEAADKAPEKPAEAVSAPQSAKGLPPLQDADDVVDPFVPKTPRTEEEIKKIESAGWYMAGRVLEARNDFTGALAAYKKAADLNPRSVEVYRSLIPLAYSLNQPNEALKYAMIAIDLDPDDYQLMHRLSAQLASEQKIADAVTILEKAFQSKRLQHDSADYVNINRDLAFLYEQTGQMELAADRFETVFDALTNPLKYHLDSEQRDILLKDALQTYEHIGDVFLKAKRTDLAIAAFKKAGAVGGKKATNLSYNLAQVYRQSQKPEEALAELENYFSAQLQSKGKGAYQLLADLLADLNRSDELIPELESLIEKDTFNQPLQHFLAAQYVEAGKLVEAEALYKKSLKDDTSDSESFAGLAGVYRRQQKPNELLGVLSKAIQSREGQELLQQELAEVVKDSALLDSLFQAGLDAARAEEPALDFGGSLILAELASEAKRTENAVEFYRYAIQARSDRAAVLYEKLGSYLLESEEFAEAVKIYQEAINHPELSNVRANFQYSLSRALELNGQTDEAVAAIREAQKTIDHPLLTYQEAWIFYHARQWDKAIPIFQKVIAQFSDGKPLAEDSKRLLRGSQMSLSNIYVQMGDIRKGEEVLETIYAEEPDDISVNNDLGYLYADQGKNLEQAEEMIRKAVAADPENAAYLDSLGWVLFKLGKYEEAHTHLEKASSLPGGGDATIWEHLGDCQSKLGKDDDAKSSWQKALDDAKKETHPDEKLLKRLHEKLPAAN
ncbi:MAG: tetratricopeptide repeat protein [Planctomycetota bacterium]|nr:tetratricopeptide repeat protein [Planctomycetota bacterium]